jgi:hypothetical protein
MGGLLMDTCQLCGKHEDERKHKRRWVIPFAWGVMVFILMKS